MKTKNGQKTSEKERRLWLQAMCDATYFKGSVASCNAKIHGITVGDGDSERGSRKRFVESDTLLYLNT